MRFPHVAPIAELADVFPRMLCRYVNVRAFDSALEQRPMAFQPVHMMNAANILFGRMIDGAVLVSVLEALIGAMFVRADDGANWNVLIDNALYRIGGHIRDRRSQQTSVAL